jgi:hypothetical protein
MTVKEREIYTLNLVVLGNFNPVIINPIWLMSKGLIRESEVRDPEIIHSEISRFELDWLSVEVTPTRMDFNCKRESDFEVLKDLVISIFSILKETPVGAFGLNHLRHYSLRNIEDYISFGYWISPVETFKGFLNTPKVFSVTYVEDVKSEEFGHFRVTISPSDLITDRKSVVFNVNHHIQNKDKTNAIEFLKRLPELWEYSFTRVDEINNGIWDKAQF